MALVQRYSDVLDPCREQMNANNSNSVIHVQPFPMGMDIRALYHHQARNTTPEGAERLNIEASSNQAL